MHQNPRVVGGEACLADDHVVEVDDTGRAVAPALILVRRLRAIESGDLHACRHLARGEHVPVRQVGVRLPLELRLVAARRARRYRPAVLHLPVRIVGCVLALVLERAVARGPVRQDRRHVNKERQAALQRRAGLVDHLATKKVLRTAQPLHFSLRHWFASERAQVGRAHRLVDASHLLMGAVALPPILPAGGRQIGVSLVEVDCVHRGVEAVVCVPAALESAPVRPARGHVPLHAVHCGRPQK